MGGGPINTHQLPTIPLHGELVLGRNDFGQIVRSFHEFIFSSYEIKSALSINLNWFYVIFIWLVVGLLSRGLEAWLQWFVYTLNRYSWSSTFPKVGLRLDGQIGLGVD